MEPKVLEEAPEGFIQFKLKSSVIKEQLILYKIPLVIGSISDVDNAQLVNTALEYQSDRLSNERTNSHYEDSKMPMSPCLENVFETMKGELQEVSKQRLKRIDHWAHIQWHNQSSTLHCHPNSLVSAVYYPQIPEDCNSPIVFEWDMGLGKKDRRVVMPKDGDYFAFPCHLLHFVTRNESNTPRVSISVNFGPN